MPERPWLRLISRCWRVQGKAPAISRYKGYVRREAVFLAIMPNGVVVPPHGYQG